MSRAIDRRSFLRGLGIAGLAAAAMPLAACGSTGAQSSDKPVTFDGKEIDVTEVKMQDISDAAAQQYLDNDEYLWLDVRKAADYDKSHIPGAVLADLDAAKNGDLQNGVDTLSSVLEKETGSSVGGDKKIIVVCYSGGSYAQTAFNLLNAMGAKMDNIYNLAGGMKKWTGETVAA